LCVTVHELWELVYTQFTPNQVNNAELDTESIDSTLLSQEVTQTDVEIAPLTIEQVVLNDANNTSNNYLMMFLATAQKGGEYTCSRAEMCRILGITNVRAISLGHRWLKEHALFEDNPTTNQYDYCTYTVSALGWRVLDRIKQIYALRKSIALSISLTVTVATPAITPISLDELYIYGVSTGYCERELQTAPARATLDPRLDTKSNEFQPDGPESDYERYAAAIRALKKESRMKIPDYVSNLSQMLHLTDNGLHKLAMFNEETINHGLLFIKTQKKSPNIFKDMVEECIRYAKEQHYNIDFAGYKQAKDDGLYREKFPTTRIVSGAAFSGSRSQSEPMSDERQTANRSREAELMAIERKKMQEKTRKWMEGKTQQQIADNIAKITPAMDSMMTDAGVAIAERKRILQEAATVPGLPIAPTKPELTQKELEIIQHKRDTVRKLEAQGDSINEFAAILLKTFRAHLEEFDKEHGIPQWQGEDLKLVNWVLAYIDKLTTTREAYRSLEAEIALGPTSPRALTGELMDGLRLFKSLCPPDNLETQTIEKVVEQGNIAVVHQTIDNDGKQFDTMVPLEMQAGMEEVT